MRRDDDEQQPADLAEWYARAKEKLAIDRDNMTAWINQIFTSYWYLEPQRIAMQAEVTKSYDKRQADLEAKHAEMARAFQQLMAS